MAVPRVFRARCTGGGLTVSSTGPQESLHFVLAFAVQRYNPNLKYISLPFFFFFLLFLLIYFFSRDGGSVFFSLYFFFRWGVPVQLPPLVHSVNTNIVRTLYVAQIMAPLNVCAISVLYRSDFVAVNKLFAMFLFWVWPFLFFSFSPSIARIVLWVTIFTQFFCSNFNWRKKFSSVWCEPTPSQAKSNLD